MSSEAGGGIALLAVDALGEVDRLLSYLERYESFIPDVFVNDYADIMAPSPGMERKDERHILNDLYIRHKRLADERNILVITASQLNAAGGKKRLVDRDNFANDIRKAANVDSAFAICQTEAQERANRGNLMVLLNRTGKQFFHCSFTKNLI